MKELLTREKLREILHYDPLTGIFTWLINNTRIKKGEVAGHVRKDSGKLSIYVLNKKYNLDRLAILWIEGILISKNSSIVHLDNNLINNVFNNLYVRPSSTKDITQKDLHNWLFYNHKTGNFSWKVSPGSGIKIGDLASSLQKSTGYIRISINNKRYSAHRLAFLYMTGKFPEKDVDHVNGDKFDNRWENLRECNKSQNSANTFKRCNNTSGYKGVYKYKDTNKWKSQIKVGNKYHHVGVFDTKEEAARAYNQAATRYFGEFARLNNV